jgi:hypothetical protein
MFKFDIPSTIMKSMRRFDRTDVVDSHAQMSFIRRSLLLTHEVGGCDHPGPERNQR